MLKSAIIWTKIGQVTTLRNYINISDTNFTPEFFYT